MSGNTFSALDLKADEFSDIDFPQFVEKVRTSLNKVRTDRDDFYRTLREDNARWANGSRYWLALGGATALLLPRLQRA